MTRRQTNSRTPPCRLNALGHGTARVADQIHQIRRFFALALYIVIAPEGVVRMARAMSNTRLASST